MIRRTARGGSIVGFVAACLVGAVLLVGSVYAVRHAGWFQSGSVASTSNSTHKSSGNSSKSGNSTNSSNSGTKGSDNTPSSTQSPSTSSGSGSSNSATAPQGSNQSGQGAQSTTNLPTTGPTEVLASLFAVGSLTAALTAYVRSRRIA